MSSYFWRNHPRGLLLSLGPMRGLGGLVGEWSVSANQSLLMDTLPACLLACLPACLPHAGSPPPSVVYPSSCFLSSSVVLSSAIDTYIHTLAYPAITTLPNHCRSRVCSFVDIPLVDSPLQHPAPPRAPHYSLDISTVDHPHPAVPTYSHPPA